LAIIRREAAPGNGNVFSENTRRAASAQGGRCPGQRDAPMPDRDRTGIGARFVFPYSRK
jgi:hypothetical protein